MSRSLSVGVTATIVASTIPAFAGFEVQSATVVHHSMYQYFPGSSATVINTIAPVSNFDTVDSNANGAIGTFDPAVLRLRTKTAGGSSGSPPTPGAYAHYNTGTLRFSSDVPFTLGTDTLDYGGLHGPDFSVVNDATQESWKWSRLPGGGSIEPQIHGTLPSPAPAGIYTFTWDHEIILRMGQFSWATYEVTLTAVPEPTAAALLGPLILVRRRRS